MSGPDISTLTNEEIAHDVRMMAKRQDDLPYDESFGPSREGDFLRHVADRLEKGAPAPTLRPIAERLEAVIEELERINEDIGREILDTKAGLEPDTVVDLYVRRTQVECAINAVIDARR